MWPNEEFVYGMLQLLEHFLSSDKPFQCSRLRWILYGFSPQSSFQIFQSDRPVIARSFCHISRVSSWISLNPLHAGFNDSIHAEPSSNSDKSHCERNQSRCSLKSTVDSALYLLLASGFSEKTLNSQTVEKETGTDSIIFASNAKKFTYNKKWSLTSWRNMSN